MVSIQILLDFTGTAKNIYIIDLRGDGMKGKINRQIFICGEDGKTVTIDLNNLFDTETDTEKKQYMRKILKDIFASYMSERQAEMSAMFYADNMSMQEIADVTGVNKSTVTRTLQRAKKAIGNNLGHYRAEFMHIAAAEGTLSNYY